VDGASFEDGAEREAGARPALPPQL